MWLNRIAVDYVIPVAGLVLILSGLLRLDSNFVSPATLFEGQSQFSAGVEITCGFLALGLRQPLVTSRLLGCLFLLFGLHATLLFLWGAPSCGCFGRVSAAPLITGMFDFAVAAVLVAFAIRAKNRTQESVQGSFRIIALIVAIIASALFFGTAIKFHSTAAAAGLLLLESHVVEPSQLGDIPVDLWEGHRSIRTIRVHNLSPWNPMRLVGMNTTCSSVWVRGFPFEVPSWGTTEIPIEFRSVSARSLPNREQEQLDVDSRPVPVALFFHTHYKDDPPVTVSLVLVPVNSRFNSYRMEGM